MVLAAGLGTRLRPLTEELPKPAVPVGNRPAIWFALDHLRRAGVRHVILNTHHLAEALRGALAGALPDGLEVTFVHEPELLGTGGGLWNARAALLADPPTVVANSDVLFAPDVGRLVAAHHDHGAIATMVLRAVPDADRWGSVEVDAGGRVRRLLGRPEDVAGPLLPLMFAGVHCLSAEAFDDLPASGCIVRHSYRRWIDDGRVVAGVVDDGPWWDLGTLPAYLDTNLALADGRLRWPGIEPVDGSLVHPAARVDRSARVIGSVVGAGATVGPGVTVERCVVWPGAVVRDDRVDAVLTPRGVVTPRAAPAG